MNKDIITYYDELAKDYDESRFSNSYGQFIDKQEREILKKIIPNNTNRILDLGCGTGRFIDFASHGVDISSEMIKFVKMKFPEKKIYNEDAANTHFDNSTFDIIISFHVFMHLDKDKIISILDEAYRLLKSGGKLIFDVPSKKRRKLIKYKSQGWHGASDFSVNEITKIIGRKWKLHKYYGILFFPIHRFPNSLRPKVLILDKLFCKSFVKQYSSYLVFEIKKI
jgi:ubiquinone/menaquinone biosynthesis C-methylase UbiE